MKALNEISDDDIRRVWEELQLVDTSIEGVENVESWGNTFRYKIKWISDAHEDTMTTLLNTLIKENRLKITSDETWRDIDFDILDYKIKVLNLVSYRGNWNKKMIMRKRSVSPTTVKLETNKDGMEILSNNYGSWWDVADESDIKNILRTLTEKYPFMKPGRNGEAHDEDIAFFMLMTQCLGEFLLKNKRVLKCYYDFRWFRDLRDGGMGQIILLKKREK